MNNYISLSRLLGSVEGVINSTFVESFWLKAEVLSAREHNGNCYIELIETDESGAEVCKHSAVAFRSSYTLIKDKMKSSIGQTSLPAGSNVLMLARVSFKRKFGLQIIVSDIDTSFTLGEMERKLVEIRGALKNKGLYDLNRGVDTPSEFTKIAVISPKNAAGLGDFKIEADILEKNSLCEFNYFSAKFEGDGVEKSIVDAFIKVHECHADYDAVVFIRGGGSKASLNQLNEYRIDACICKFPIPVFCGVGHERDKILADEVANLSFDTPSKVIEFISNTIFNNASTANESILRSSVAIENLIDREKSNIDRLSLSVKGLAGSLINNFEISVNEISSELIGGLSQTVTKESHQLRSLASEMESTVGLKIQGLEFGLDRIYSDTNNVLLLSLNRWKDQLSSAYREAFSLSPLNTLERGYTFTTINNTNINSIDSIDRGLEITTRTKKETIKSIITEVKPNE